MASMEAPIRVSSECGESILRGAPVKGAVAGNSTERSSIEAGQPRRRVLFSSCLFKWSRSRPKIRKHFFMARYFKLAPLVFCLCACLLLLVIGCAKAPADLLKDARASLIPDPAKALDQAQAAIDKLTSEPAGTERDKMLFEAKVMKLEALGFVDSAKAKSEYESLRKEAPSLMTGQVLWDVAVELREGSVGQGTAIALLDQGKKDF